MRARRQQQVRKTTTESHKSRIEQLIGLVHYFKVHHHVLLRKYLRSLRRPRIVSRGPRQLSPKSSPHYRQALGLLDQAVTAHLLKKDKIIFPLVPAIAGFPNDQEAREGDCGIIINYLNQLKTEHTQILAALERTLVIYSQQRADSSQSSADQYPTTLKNFARILREEIDLEESVLIPAIYQLCSPPETANGW